MHKKPFMGSIRLSLVLLSVVTHLVFISVSQAFDTTTNEVLFQINRQEDVPTTRSELIKDFNNLNLTRADKLYITDASIQMLTNCNPYRSAELYVLKYDTLPALRNIRRKVIKGINNFRFHLAISRVFVGIKNSGSNIFIPSRLHDATAELGFRISEFYDEGNNTPRYLRTSIRSSIPVPEEDFPRGSELITFDGKPFAQQALTFISRYVGTNEANNRARAELYFLRRILSIHKPPRRKFATIGYIHPNGTRFSVRFPWNFVAPPASSVTSRQISDSDNVHKFALSSNAQMQMKREEENEFLEPPAVIRQNQETERLERTTFDFSNPELSTYFGQKIMTLSGPIYRISVRREAGFFESEGAIQELSSFLNNVTKDGQNLVIDLRGCVGGSLVSVMRLFELIAPDHVLVPPNPFSVTTTDITSAIAEADGSFLEFFRPAMREARINRQSIIQGGDLGYLTFQSRPKRLKSAYQGRLLVATDGFTYGTCESLTRWISDEGLGEIAGVHGSTAGLSSSALSYAGFRFFVPEVFTRNLPLGIRINVPLTRDLRSGLFSGSTYMYKGLPTKHRYFLSRTDIETGNDGFYNFLGKLLKDMGL